MRGTLRAPANPPVFEDAQAALDEAYTAITSVVTGLDEGRFTLPTRCSEWSVRELLFHQLLDARRALVTFASPSNAAADVDFATYWLAFTPGSDGARRHAGYVQRAAAAYASPRSLVEEWTETAGAAVRAAAATDRESRVTTQGHVLNSADFVTTLVVEAAIHHLDLTLEIPAPQPRRALEHAVRTLDAVLGTHPDLAWSDDDYVLTATGRRPLTNDERIRLGALGSRLPVLG
jgi:uncharacterized protein (TIGR03083 family)